MRPRAFIAPTIALAALAGACSGEMSNREYCTRRETAWEMAFPTLTLSDADRSKFVESCVANLAKADSGELARSLRCMNQHLKGRGHAYEQYVEFTRCEQVDPSRER
jgi:hypothetical protein